MAVIIADIKIECLECNGTGIEVLQVDCENLEEYDTFVDNN